MEDALFCTFTPAECLQFRLDADNSSRVGSEISKEAVMSGPVPAGSTGTVCPQPSGWISAAGGEVEPTRPVYRPKPGAGLPATS